MSRRGWFIAFVAVGLVSVAVGLTVTREPALPEAEAAFRARRFDEACAIATEIAHRRPDNAAAWRLLASSAQHVEDYTSAADAWERAAALAPLDDADRWNFVQCLLHDARVSQAERQLWEILRDQPGDEQALTELQWLLFHQLRERELQALLESRLEQNPADFTRLYHLLYSRQRPPNPREAVGRLEEIDRRRPDQPEVQLALGRCYWKLGRAAEARPLLEAAWQARPEHSEFCFVLAEFELDCGRLEAVERLLEAADARWPNDDRRWWLAAQLADRQRDGERALAAIRQAIELRPEELRYRNVAAGWLQAAGRSAEAAPLLESVRRMSAAEQELYIIVQRGDLERPASADVARIAELCAERGLTRQAEGWSLLARRR